MARERKIGTKKVGGRATCTRCHRPGTEDDPLIWDEDPYDAEINSDYTLQWMHEDCRRDAADDI